jgi:hypothetical protein
MIFSIENAGAADGPPWSAEYDSLEHARVALRAALDWSEIWLAPGYTGADGSSQIWHAYRTREEADSDRGETNAPRVVRHADRAFKTA